MRFGRLKEVSVFLLAITAFLCTCRGQMDHDGFVEDRGGLLGEREKERIRSLNGRLLQELDIHMKVIILDKRVSDIDQAAVNYLQKDALGRETEGARGILLLVDPQGHQVRLEVGYDLEPIFPDGFVGYIERKQMTPFFQAGRLGPGVEATVELLVARALDGLKTIWDGGGRARDLSEDHHYSGGGGATVKVEIGSGLPAKESSPWSQQFGAQASPRETIGKYMEVLRLHTKDPNLGLYTPETREFFGPWVVTDGQQDNELRELEEMISSSRVFRQDHLAVIRFPIENRQISPYFLSRGDTGWMLDFASMNKIIGFNHTNQWFFRTTDHPYMFAFEDVRFDKNGFPHRPGASSAHK
jgi:hypothetical protein